MYYLSSTRGASSRSAPERILVMVAETRNGCLAHSGGARHRLRALQSARQRLSHGEDRRQDDIRSLRLPQRRAAFHGRGAEGEKGLGRPDGVDRGEQTGYTYPDSTVLSACREDISY